MLQNPKNSFFDVEFVLIVVHHSKFKGGFGMIYKAKWKGIYDVALKKLCNSQNITTDFLNEVRIYYKIKYLQFILFYNYRLKIMFDV